VEKKRDFIKQFFKEKKTVGAVSPSSRYLLKKMLKNIDFENSKVIVEFGPGTGVFTKELLKQKNEDCILIVIELNDVFYEQIEKEFSGINNVILRKDSAENLDAILEELGLEKVDTIVSSLPLAVIPKTIVDKILLVSKASLRPNGQFIQFQYSLTSKRKLEKYFDSIKVTFTARNIPPAFVYTCSN
jgi:phosphatidylethanolamine/phosphatidyl-N-methylethanolamine N-methyltransferase